LLDGVIPESICNLELNWSSIYNFNISNNELCPPYPDCIEPFVGNQTIIDCDGIVELWDELYFAEGTTELSLAYQGLTGPIPAEIGYFTHLTHLDLSYNQLTGPLPVEIGNLDSLRYFNVAYNQLTGQIPSSIGNLSRLTDFKLYSNSIAGSLPAEMGNLVYLEYLNVYNNQLTGAIPPELGNLNNLNKLYLHHNQFSGGLPTEIFNLTDLTDLYLNDNQFTGVLSSEISSLENLERLRLQNNQLSELIPEEICDINLDWSNPISFNISNNYLCQPYPYCIQGYEGNQDTSNCSQVSIIDPTLPLIYELHNAYPNPFNPLTTIQYALPVNTGVQMTIYDMMGRVVKTLVSRTQGPGFQSIQWNATNDRGESVSAGIYLCTIEAGHFRQTRKMVLLK